MTITAVPTTYRGTRFRSTLEADWAATFDFHGWYWEYEPVALELGDGTRYLPDFYLPLVRVWCEVKGPHDERVEKPHELNRQLYAGAWLEENTPFVVLLRPAGPGDRATWESCDPSIFITVGACPYCDVGTFFTDLNGPWRCRRCLHELEKWEAGAYESGGIHFERAPRATYRQAA